MSLENTNIAVVSKNTIVKAEVLRAAKTGSAVKIKAVEGAKYILAEGENGVAPENITVQRVGKDLHVMLEGTDANSPQLVIEDYFDKPGELVGKGEDGQWHQFISTDGDSQHDAALLVDGESSPLALGANTVSGLDGLVVAEGAIAPALLALGALAALAAAFGLGYLIAHHNNDHNGTSDTGAGGPIDDSGVAMPTVSTITDNTGLVTGPLTNGQSTDETLPVFTGTGTPGNTIELRDNGVVIGSGVVGADGNWSVQPEAPLAEGPHEFDLVAKDAAGNESQPTTPVTIIVDLSPPEPATGLLLNDNVGTETGAITANSITDDTTPTYSGKAEPGTLVFITDNGQTLGSAPVDAAGNWSFTPREPMSAGEHSFSTIVQDAAGNQSQPTPPLTFVIDPNGLSATIDYVIDDTNGTPENLTSGSLTKDNTPTLFGHGTVRSVVYIYEEGNTTPIGSARVLGNGTWTFPTGVLPDGPHTFIAIPRDASGTPGNQSAEFDLNIDTTAPTRPGLNNDGIESVWDDVGLIQGPIANGGSTDDTTPTLKGSHLTPGDTVYVYDGVNLIGTEIVDANGGWSHTPSPALNPGDHNFSIVVGDPAGNLSEHSDPWLVHIDTTPPSVPVITEVIDDVGAATGAITPGGTTDDAWPTVHGTADANTLVMIYDRLNNGSRVLLGSTTADALGNWEFTPEMQLSNGHHSLSVVGLDDVRNTSAESPLFDFDLVTGGIPSAPAITSAFDDIGAVTGTLQSGATTDDTQPTLNGTAPANSLVTLYVDQKAVASFTAGADGHWSWTPDAALTTGPHNFTATATDANGAVSQPTAEFALNIDTSAPDAADNLHLSDNVGPVQGEIVDGSTTDDSTPTFSGSAEPGATVIIRDNGKVIGSETVQPDGSWSFTPKDPLADGHHEFSTIVQDPVGNQSGESAPIGFDVDTSNVFISIDYAIDDAGSITQNLSSGDATDDATPTLVGKAKANAIVTVYDGTTLLGSAQANAEGKWSFPSPTLTEGLHHITATATDAAGTSATSSQFDLNIDLTAPEVGSGIGDIWDNVGPVQGLVPSNGATDDTTPTLRGSGQEPGDTITVRDGDDVLGTTVVKDDGTWDFTPESPLADGTHDFTIIVTDPVGNVSAPSDPYIIDIDTDVPLKPAIVAVIDDQGSLTGPIAAGGITDDSRPTITGTAPAGTVVSVYDNNQLIGTVTAGTDGSWSLTPEFPLPYGPHELHAVASDAVGNVSLPSDPFDFDLITGGIPSAPSIIGAVDDVGSVTGMLSSNGVTDDVRPELVGNAPANSQVTITVDGEVKGVVTADAQGQWHWTPDADLSEGPHKFSVVATDAAGNVSAPSGDFNLEIDLTAPDAAQAELTDDVGAVTGVIADGSITDDSTPTFTGTAEPGSTVIIRDGDQVIGSEKADANGDWSFTPKDPLAEGPHEFSTVVQDPAGNLSAPSDPIHFVVDTSAVVVSIDYAVDDAGSVTGNLATGAVTDDTTPTLFGKATPNGLVMISDNGVVIGSATADAFGDWHYLPDPVLAEGPHSFSASVTNGAGNTATTAPFNLDVDLTAPVIPGNDGIGDVRDDVGTITGSVPDGGVTDDSTPTLVGSGLQPGDTVTIRDGGQPIGTAIVGEDGSWHHTPNPPLDEGTHDFDIIVTDPAGNESAPSDPWTIIVDVTPPAVPVISTIVDDQGDLTGDVARGGITDDTQPEIHGTADANTLVNVYDNGVLIGSAQADANGDWLMTPLVPLTGTDHALTAKAVDAAGNISQPSDKYDFSLAEGGDVIAQPPVITGGFDDVAPQTGDLTSGDATNDQRPTLKGTGHPGDVIELFDGTTSLGTTQVQEDGSWSMDPNQDLSEGPHSLTAVATNAVGNHSAPSNGFDLDIDLTAPAQPAISTLIDDQGDLVGDVARGGLTDDTQPEIHGTADANTLVNVYDNGVLIGSARADVNGDWSMTPQQPLTGPDHALTAEAVDAAGNVSQPSDAYDFSLAEGGDVIAQPPAITGGFDDVEPKTGDLASGDATNDQRPTLKGTGHAGDVIELFDGTTSLGTTQVQPDGTWSMDPNQDLSEGPHSLTAVATNAAGNHSAPSNGFDLNVDLTAPVIPGNDGIGDVRDDVGSITGSVPDGGVTDDDKPTLIGSGLEPGDTVTVRDGGLPIGTAIVGDDGSWTFTPEDPLDEGTHDFDIVVTDPAGNESTPSDPWTVEIDLTPPGQPTITTIVDDQGDLTGDVARGGVTDDTQPEIHGTADANTLVNVYDNDVLIGSAQADANGDWSMTPQAPLSGPDHVLTAKAVDKAGNVSIPSEDYNFNLIDGGAAQAPIITGGFDDVAPKTGDLVSGDDTNDQRPLLKGTGHPGDVVELFEGSESLGTTIVAGDGSWSMEPNRDLTEGPHSLTAVATNSAGNHSEPSNAFDLNIDLTAPTIPGNQGIGDVIDDQGSITGSIPNGGSTDDTTPTLVGSGLQPGDTVTVRDGGEPIGTATVGDDGSWSFTPNPALDEGTHDFTIVVSDPAGNESAPSDPWIVEVDLTPPGQPAITAVIDDQGDLTGDIARGGITDDNLPEIHGTADANTLVNVYDNDVLIGSAQVGSDGSWSLIPDVALSGPDHLLTAKAVDAAGNVSVPSDEFGFSLIDGGAAQTPVITAGFDDTEPKTGDLASGDATNDQRPTLRGTGHAGDTIELFDGTTSVGTTQVQDDGTWSMDPNVDLSEGAHRLTAVATNAAGNHSDASNAFDLDVDLTAPTHPGADDDGIRTIIDDVGPKVGDVADGGVTDDQRPTLLGDFQAEGSTIYVYDNNNLLGTAIVGMNGDWSYTPDVDLAEGPHTFTIKVEDRAGWTSDMSDPYAITIDITPPEKPTITEVIDDQGAHTGALNPGEITDDAQPQINGTAEANSKVFIYDGTTLIGSATVDGDGNWTHTPFPPLQAGAHNISVVAQDAAGLVSVPSDPFDFSVLTGGVPSAVAITTVWDDAGTTTGNVQSNGFTDDTTPTVKGTAPANTLVTVTFSGPGGATVVASATSDASGSWSVTPPALGQGRYSIIAEALDPALNPIQSGAWIVNIDTTAPLAPVITAVTDDVTGGIVGNLPNGSVTNDNRPTLSGTAEAGSVVRIYDGATLVGSITATGGNWSITTPVLGSGPHSLTATATDAAGNISPATAARTFTVDTTPPVVTVTAVNDDVSGGIVGNLPNGSVTNDSKPTLSGTAEVGSVVRIYDGATLLGSFTATAATWTYETPVLATGPHSLTATATDPAGNVSAATAARTLTVDTTAPNVPVIGAVTDDVAGGIVGNVPNGSVTNDNRPTLSGTAEAGSVVRIYDGATLLGSITATGGNWSYLTPVLGSGPHSLTATATDAAGNVSAATAARTLTVDTTAPNAPVVDTIIDNVGPATGDIANGATTDDNTPTLNGHTEANALVKITLDGTVYSTTANASGVWTFASPTLALGAHTYSITATDAAGNTSLATTRSLNVVSPIPDGAKGTENFEYATAQQTPIVSGAKLASGLTISCSWSGYAIMTVVGQGHHAAIYASATHATRLTWGNGVHTTDVHFDLVAPTAAAAMQPTVIMVYSSTGALLTKQTVSSASRFNYEAPAGQSIGAVDLYVAGSTDAAPAQVGFDNVSWGEKASGVITTASVMGDEVSDQLLGVDSVDNAHDRQVAQHGDETAQPQHDGSAASGNAQSAQPVSNVAPAVVEQPQAPVQEAQHAGVTLTLDHAEQPIDFSAVVAAGETVSKVNMTNAQSDTLNITLEDVMTHGEANAFIADGAKQMLIQGEKGDVVNLSDLLPKGADTSDWSKANSPVSVDGVQYEVYQHGSNDAELLVQMGVQTNLNTH
jgi:hypothetical protein